jgi:hypothetical protein
VTVESHGGMISTAENFDLFTRALWQSYQQSPLIANQEELAKEVMNFVL